MQLSLLNAAGSPATIGQRHAQSDRPAIRRFAAERVERACQALWIGIDRPRSELLALADDCLTAHEAYSPGLTAELSAMAEVCGLSRAEMLIVSGFTDFVDTAFAVFNGQRAGPIHADNCTAMIVPGTRSATGTPLFAQTWDMHESATEHVFVLNGAPDAAPAFTVFTSRGCLGMIGMNEAGITIGINNLTGADGQVGVTWNLVVREVLAQSNFETAAQRLADAELAGAHNYLLVGPDGQGLNVEATATRREITPLADTPLVHTNHCLSPATREAERPRQAASQRHSEHRLARARELLETPNPIDIDRLAAITRDTQALCYPPTPITRMTTCGAVVADPAARRLWALRGRPSEQRYVEIDVARGRIADQRAE